MVSRAVMLLLLSIVVAGVVAAAMMSLLAAKKIPADKVFNDRETGERSVVLINESKLTLHSMAYSLRFDYPNECFGWYSSVPVRVLFRFDAVSDRNAYDGNIEWSEWLNYSPNALRIRDHARIQYRIMKPNGQSVRVIYYETDVRAECGRQGYIPLLPDDGFTPIDVFTRLLGLEPVEYSFY